MISILNATKIVGYSLMQLCVENQIDLDDLMAGFKRSSYPVKEVEFYRIHGMVIMLLRLSEAVDIKPFVIAGVSVILTETPNPFCSHPSCPKNPDCWWERLDR